MSKTAPRSSIPSALWQAIRPHQWVKNTVVFTAPCFALVPEIGAWVHVGWAFVAFCLLSSSFYLLNDAVDAEADRTHPLKRHRPIARGDLSAPVALSMSALFSGVSLAVSYLLSPLLGFTLVAYAILQGGYNAWFKKMIIIDIMVIALGFVLRALGGAAAAGVAASGWFVLCVGLLAFFLGIEKRKAELRAVGDSGETRAVLQHYTLGWMHRMESVVTASALMAYALWTIEGAASSWMLLTVPMVAYAVFRYQYLTEQGAGEEPEKTLLRDPGMIGAVLLWLATALAILLATQAGVVGS